VIEQLKIGLNIDAQIDWSAIEFIIQTQHPIYPKGGGPAAIIIVTPIPAAGIPPDMGPGTNIPF
jgi:hypothetical protein